MDPNANLKEILELAKWIKEEGDSVQGYARGLAELILALNEWITKGGFLPSRWQKPVDAIGKEL
uniref:Uncharacterized protein n=1 Tax=viral metagenome TaxID=1070528 RepID=A0A6H2A3L2_9ZZZZ